MSLSRCSVSEHVVVSHLSPSDCCLSRLGTSMKNNLTETNTGKENESQVGMVKVQNMRW